MTIQSTEHSRRLASAGRPGRASGRGLALACIGVLAVACGGEAPVGPIAVGAPAGSLEARYAEEVFPILAAKCADCHHAEVEPPWYAAIPIVGTRVMRDIEWGRQRLDFATLPPWNSGGPVGERGFLFGLRTAILDDTMPPIEYLLTHPLGTLTEEESQTLLTWTEDSLASLARPVDALEIHEKVGIVMADRCARCHQESVANEMNGGFDFVTELAFLAEDEDYIEPEDPEASPLFEHLVGDEDTMPPSPRDRLSENEIEWVRVWIEEGAPTAE